ncbi:MAG: hypothetical protein GY859_01840 [Desulfobacterales bacterium]|nr:hypothetical protein [Desulfobacterales bacterium]
MTEYKEAETSKPVAKLCIWTIRHHNYLITQFRLYMWSAVAIVLFLSLANVIHLKAALWAILISVLCIVILLWALIERRRTCLLRIGDSDLKEQAHAAMLEFIHERKDKLKKGGHFWSRLRHTLDV